MSIRGFTIEGGTRRYIEISLADYVDHYYDDYNAWFIGSEAARKTQLCAYLAMIFFAGKNKQYVFQHTKRLSGQVTLY